MSQNTVVRAWSNLNFMGMSFVVAELDAAMRGFYAVAAPIEMRPVRPGDWDSSLNPAPTFSLAKHAAQQLMDDLYAAGLRPTEAADNAGALAATKLHLADMKSLSGALMKTMGIKDP